MGFDRCGFWGPVRGRIHMLGGPKPRRLAGLCRFDRWMLGASVACGRSCGGVLPDRASGFWRKGQVDVGSMSLRVGNDSDQIDHMTGGHRLMGRIDDAGVDALAMLVDQGDANRQGVSGRAADVAQPEADLDSGRAVGGGACGDVLELQAGGVDRQANGRIGRRGAWGRFDNIDPKEIGRGHDAQPEYGQDRPDRALDDGLVDAPLLDDLGAEGLGQFGSRQWWPDIGREARRAGQHAIVGCGIRHQIEGHFPLSAPGESAGGTANRAAIWADRFIGNKIASGTVGTGQYHGVAGVAPHLPEFARPIMPSPASAPMSSAVRFETVGLRYDAYGPEVLRDVDFTLPAGSFHFLTGASGAGKSSLLKLIYLGAAPSRGQVTVFGQETTRISPADRTSLRRRMGVVFHDFQLIDHLTAFDNAALPLRVAGQKPKAYSEDVQELLNWVGLGARIESYPPALSAGEKQRLAIARAVVGRPWLILADEPTGAVDDDMAVRILRLFVELNRLGATVLIATHDHELVGRSGMPSLHLDRGRLTQVPA